MVYEGGKYNICSGSGRSGTSLMMLALRQAGVPITGFRYGIYLTNFTFHGNKLDFGVCFPSDEMQRANPNGVWEISSVAAKNGLTDYYKDIGFKGDVIKVVSRVLVRSNPNLIDKTIIMLREPKALLSSMINCGMFTRSEASNKSSEVAQEIIGGIQFLKENRKKFIIVSYEGFLEEPENTMKRVCEFMGRGDYKYGAKVPDKTLNHGKVPINDLGDISKLEEVYQTIL